MGQDYHNCAICDIIFGDYGEYGHCSNCGEILCGQCHDEQIEKYGHPEEGSEAALDYGEWSPVKCDLCSGVIILDKDILQFLLGTTNLTKGEVTRMMREDHEFLMRGNN